MLSKEMLQYESIKREIEKLKQIISAKEDECAKKGKSFDEMIDATKNERIRLFEIDKDLRLVQDPSIDYTRKWKGTRMPIEEFAVMCGTELTDDDGYGLYATEVGVSDIKIYPSDVIEDKYRNDFTHVMWFDVIKGN